VKGPPINPLSDEFPSAKLLFTRRHHAWLAAGFLAFVIYGSFVPFHFRPMPWEEAVATYRQALIFRGFDSRSDLAANILLFIPLSYLLLAATSVDRPRWVSWVIAPPVLLFCFLLSASIEFIQVFFEKRYADINDIIGESIGAGIGAVIWLGFGRMITGWFRKVWSANLGPGLASLLLPGYLVLLVLYYVLPLDLTLSPAEIAHKYRDGKIQIVPYAIPPGDRFEWFEKQCWTVALFFPVGMLWAGRPLRTRNVGAGWLIVLGLAFVLAGSITFLKIFVVSRYVETGDVITGTLAIFLGWLLVVTRFSGSLASNPLKRVTTNQLGRAWPLFFAAVWLAMAVYVNWHPFDFQPDLGTAVDRLRNLSWLPFADYIQGSYVNFLNQIVRKSILFLPMGLLLASWGTNRNRSFNRFWMLMPAVSLAVILEIGQAFLPSRYPSVTDVLVETTGTGIGLVLAPHGPKRLVGQEPNPVLVTLSAAKGLEQVAERDSSLRSE
jgi:glycopeptide antibiotics resistance protein